MFVNFTITGMSSLLMHADDVESSDSLTEWRKDPDNKNISKAGDDRSPAWTWQTYLYISEGKVAWPYANLMACLRKASAQVIMKGQKTFKEISQSGLVPHQEFMAFSVADGKEITTESLKPMRSMSFSEQVKAANNLGFSLDVRRAKIGKAKHVRVRPRFDKWTLQGRLEVIMPELTADIIKTIFSIAGNVGMGDWRPGCSTPGPFGRFDTAVKFSK
jgi:hypothetical protein